MESVTSRDGTTIAYEMFGQGRPLIAVCGATCDRALMRSTAQALGQHFATVNYDRRGRGDSGDTLPYAVDREIEDIAALIDEVGGPAHLYGHSSGAGLVLHAVAAGLPVDRFVLHDPPYSPDDASSKEAARSFARTIHGLLAEDKRAEAIETWFRGTGMPDDMLEGMRQTPGWPGLIALAPTLAYESAVMGDIENGGAIPEEVAARATRPGLVLVGGDSPPFMMEVSRRLADLLPRGRHRVLEGQGHVAAPEVLAPVVAGVPPQLTVAPVGSNAALPPLPIGRRVALVSTMTARTSKRLRDHFGTPICSPYASAGASEGLRPLNQPAGLEARKLGGRSPSRSRT